MALTLDTTGLATALRQKLEVTERAMPEVLNKAGKDVSLRAVQFTDAVSPDRIAAEMRRVVATQIAGKSGRRLKRAREVHAPTTLARAIIVARLKKKGGISGMTRADIDTMAVKMAAARVRSASYLKAGFLPAARVFGAAANGVRQWGADHGSGRLATVDHLLAEIRNDVPEGPGWHPGAPAYQRAVEALQRAVDFVTADILVYVDRKLAEAGFVR